jgi:hypothetical protein
MITVNYDEISHDSNSPFFHFQLSHMRNVPGGRPTHLVRKAGRVVELLEVAFLGYWLALVRGNRADVLPVPGRTGDTAKVPSVSSTMASSKAFMFFLSLYRTLMEFHTIVCTYVTSLMQLAVAAAAASIGLETRSILLYAINSPALTRRTLASVYAIKSVASLIKCHTRYTITTVWRSKAEKTKIYFLHYLVVVRTRFDAAPLSATTQTLACHLQFTSLVRRCSLTLVTFFLFLALNDL